MNCPNCDTYISITDVVEDSGWDGTSHYDIVKGSCSKCGKTYQWVEVFTFDHIEDVQEITPDE